MENENGSEPKLYNNRALCEAVGLEPYKIRTVAEKAGVTPSTVRRAMNGDPKIVMTRLVRIAEAAGAKYANIFDPEFYEANKPTGAERN